MRFLLKLSSLIVFVLFASVAAHAQQADWTKVLSSLPAVERLEGTLTVQGYQTEIGLGGGTAVARVQFEKPDSLRIEMQAEPARGIRGIIVVAQGKSTRIYDPVSHRLRELPYNIAVEWWRGWSVLNGGPANIIFNAFSPEQLSSFYTVATGDNGASLQMKAAPAQARFQPDFVRVGGSGNDIFYAPYLQKVWDYAPQTNWKFDANGLPLQREEGEAEKVLYRTALTFDAVSHLPQKAVVTDFNGRHVATFTYDLKTAPQPFDKSTFEIPAAQDQISETAHLVAPASYSGNDAATLYNKGVALAMGEEDYAGAYAAWQQASKANPKAVAPWFALYESALLTHDLNRAKSALDQLTQILGADNEDVLTRQASLAISYLRWKDAETALAALNKAYPENATYLLALANLQRSQGKTAAERGALGQILSMPQTPQGMQAAAALNWAQNALTGVDRTASDIEQKTAAQQLTKQMVEMINGAAKVEDSAFADSGSLLTSLALMQEAMGQKQQAATTWTKVAEIFPYPLDGTAHWHLLALAAQRGDEETAMQQYQAVRATTFGRDAVRRLHDQLINTWQKAFGQEKLEQLLKNRAVAMRASEDDTQLWLAYQSTFGTQEDLEAAIKNGATRFPQDAWWHSQRAESLSSLATSSDPGRTMSVDELLNVALQSVDKAIALAPDQPYYAIQKALILRTRAMANPAIIDPHKRQEKLDAAEAAYQQFAKKWADNSDVELAADIVRLPLDEANERTATLQSIDDTLHNAEPLQASYRQDNASAVGGNHMRAFTARQAKASIARRMGDFAAVTRYYQELLVSSRSADEEQGVALNYLRQAIYQKNIPAINGLLMRLSHEPWKWDDLSSMMNAAGSVLSLNPPMAMEVIKSLQDTSDPYAHWAAERLSATLAASASLALHKNKDTDELEAQQNGAMNALVTALQSLVAVTDGDDKILASRAAAALGESALERALQGSGKNQDKDAIDAAKTAADWYEKAGIIIQEKWHLRVIALPPCTPAATTRLLFLPPIRYWPNCRSIPMQCARRPNRFR